MPSPPRDRVPWEQDIPQEKCPLYIVSDTCTGCVHTQPHIASPPFCGGGAETKWRVLVLWEWHVNPPAHSAVVVLKEPIRNGSQNQSGDDASGGCDMPWH